MSDDEYRVYMMHLPGTIKAAVKLDNEGFPSIYINDALAPDARKKAFIHELRHIERDDFFNDLPIEEVESEE